MAPVGAYASGKGRWNHQDLAGNLHEWTIDWYAIYSAYESSNYANIAPGSIRVIRGGCYGKYGNELRAANRAYYMPDVPRSYVGVRCARTVQ